MTFTLTHYAYCGMRTYQATSDQLQDSRDKAAAFLRRRRRQGYPVATLARGREWEIQEPPGAVMVPDQCGVLAISEGGTADDQ